MMPRQSAGPKSAINDAPSRVSALRSLSCTLQEKLNQSPHCLMYNQRFSRNYIFFVAIFILELLIKKEILDMKQNPL